MRRLFGRWSIALLFAGAASAQNTRAPHALTWQETLDQFKANNPTLLAGQVTIGEARADEITAYLRPNPDFTFTADGTQITPHAGIWQPFAGTLFIPSLSYLHEREHKRELRLSSAQKATAIAISAQADLERNLVFNLKDAFNRVLLAKEVVAIAREDLEFFDKELAINRDRYQVGNLAKVDFQRLDLQRVQFESDLETAQVDLRTAKIDLLALLRETTPVEQFDVKGEFAYQESTVSLPALHSQALDNRPDLKEAQQSVEKARTDHQLAIANGSTDPTYSAWWTHNGSFNNPGAYNTIGASVSIPLRIFDRNQGDKLHTLLDIGRNEKLRDAAQVTVLHDVDSAYASLESTIDLLKPYKSKYLEEAEQVRSTVSFAYQHGAASLLDFLDAEREYRDTRLAYVNLVGAYFSAANQLNFAVGQEVIQ